LAGGYGMSLAETKQPSFTKLSYRVPTHELKVGSYTSKSPANVLWGLPYLKMPASGTLQLAKCA